MSIHVVTTQEKLDFVERLLIDERRDSGHRNEILKALASDLRGRLSGAPTVALVELERRMIAAKHSKTSNGYSGGAMVGLAEELIGRWPSVKQSLELFGAEIENGRDVA